MNLIFAEVKGSDYHFDIIKEMIPFKVNSILRMQHQWFIRILLPVLQIVFEANISTYMHIQTVLDDGKLIILFFSGRESSNPVIRLAKGAYGLYGTTSYLSDILSYSRLLALGLATGVIAQVFNQIGSMMGDSFISLIIFIIIFVIGHGLNIGINALGAYVHTNRLQFVEFFGKFYKGGGRGFDPYKINTKHYTVKEDI